MAVIDALNGYEAGVPFRTSGALFVLENTIDFDALNVASGDVIQALPVGAGMRVLLVETEIVTPSDAGTSATATIGDGDDDDGFDADVDLKATAGTIVSTGSGDAYAVSGKRYTEDDTIDIIPTWSGDVSVKGKVKIRALVAKMG
ncbi:MAG: hypothetical protein DRH57_00280 [Candidatus Cloacimonadota bacterium]|nr:MAG: hypothetical protein DRH57_00280 [Candidatus Cloacimonadota bacterium]